MPLCGFFLKNNWLGIECKTRKKVLIWLIRSVKNMLQPMQLLDLVLQISYKTILNEIIVKFVIGFGRPTKC